MQAKPAKSVQPFLVAPASLMYLVTVHFRLSPLFRHSFFLAGLTVLFVGVGSHAQLLGTPGAEEFSGLSISPSARFSGMAEASTALSDGSGSIGSNPAGLLSDSGFYRYAGSFRAHPDGANAGAIAYSRPAGNGGQFAFSATYFDYGAITPLDEQGNVIAGDIRPVNLYPSLTYARALGGGVRVGATVKMAQEYLGDFQGSQSAFGIGADVGVLIQPAVKNLGFGFSLVNVGKKIVGHFHGDQNLGYLPGSIKSGMFYQPSDWQHVLTTLDAELPFYEAPRISVGLEYRYSPQWELRAGTRWDYHDIMNTLGTFDALKTQMRYGSALKATAGTTLKMGRAAVDYAIQWWVDLGWVHSMTLAWTLGT